MLTLYLLTLFLSISREDGCRERDRPISSPKADSYTIIDAKLFQEVTLQCHYCNEEDDSQPRNWYKIDNLGLSQPHELELSMENNMDLNRIRVNTDHTLIIKNFSEPDKGLYICKGLQEDKKNVTFQFLVDVVYDLNITEMESGNLTEWSRYHAGYFASINRMFEESKGEEFVYVREHLKLSLEVISQWDPWGVCQICGRAKGDAIRKKRGYCRIKLTTNSNEKKATDVKNKLDPDVSYLLNSPAISCRSMRLKNVLPGISNLTKVIPDFIQHEKCEGICNPDAEGANAGWKVGKSKGFKFRKTFVLPENSHLALVCPESSLDNVTIWRKRGKILKPGDASNPHLVVNTFNTLYLLDVTDNESGNYTCQVDDIKMQQVIVFIVTKSRLLTHEMLRHLLYLGFILALTATCYCAGLIIACHRRDTFKSYDELIDEHPEDKEELEDL